jgi:hypothetical protein
MNVKGVPEGSLDGVAGELPEFRCFVNGVVVGVGDLSGPSTCGNEDVATPFPGAFFPVSVKDALDDEILSSCSRHQADMLNTYLCATGVKAGIDDVPDEDAI